MTDVPAHELTVADLDAFKAKPVSTSYAANLRTFYSPIDDVHGALKAVIASAQHSPVCDLHSRRSARRGAH